MAAYSVLLEIAEARLTTNGLQWLPVTAGTAVLAATLAVGLQVYAPAFCKMIQS